MLPADHLCGTRQTGKYVGCNKTFCDTHFRMNGNLTSVCNACKSEFIVASAQHTAWQVLVGIVIFVLIIIGVVLFILVSRAS